MDFIELRINFYNEVIQILKDEQWVESISHDNFWISIKVKDGEEWRVKYTYERNSYPTAEIASKEIRSIFTDAEKLKSAVNNERKYTEYKGNNKIVLGLFRFGRPTSFW